MGYLHDTGGVDTLAYFAQQLQKTKAAVLLLDADFFASPLILDQALPLLLTAVEQGTLRIFPVLVGPCQLELYPGIARYQPAHDSSRPLWVIATPQRREEWWAQVAQTIYTAAFASGEQDGKQLSHAEKIASEQKTNVRPRKQQNIRQPGLFDQPMTTPSFPVTLNHPQGTVIGEHNTVTISFYNTTPAVPVASEPPLQLDDFLAVYREKLHDDPEIAKLQILGMREPLSVSDLYVRVRLHDDPRPHSRLDFEQQQSRDPLMALQQRQAWIERRSSSSMDPAEAVKRHRNCVIVGDPGAGKTTLLKRLTLSAIDGALEAMPVLPLYIKLHKVARKQQFDLFAASVDVLVAYGFSRAQVTLLLEERMKAGDILLLLDALDETVIGETSQAAEESYRQVHEAILNMKRRFNRIPVVVTARKAGYFQRGQLPGFTELEVLDFLPRDIEEFIGKWFRHGSEERQALAPRLIAALKNNPRIATLAANPLLLSLLAITYEHDDPTLPESRADLYKRCVDTLLSRWDAERFIPRYHILNREDRKQLLQQVAWHFHQQGLRYFSKRDLCPLIEDFLESLGKSSALTEAVLQEVAGEEGLLREQADEIYGFLHLTMQEYFVAVFANEDVNLLLPYLGSPWWEEIVLLFAGQVRDASMLLAYLVTYRGVDEVPEDIFSTKLVLAGRCLAARPRLRTDRSLRDTIPQRLFQLLEEVPYALLRQHVAEVLTEIARTDPYRSIAGKLLSYMLTMPEEGAPLSQDALFEVLSSFGSEQLASLLLDLSLEQHTLTASPFFLDIFSRYGTSDMASRLLPLLNDAQADNWFRMYVISLLGAIGDHIVLPTLHRLLRDTQQDELLRVACIKSLAMLKDLSIVPALLAFLADPHTSKTLLSTSIIALRRIRDRSIVADVVQLLSDLFLSEDVRIEISLLVDVLYEEHIVAHLASLLHDSSLGAGLRARIATLLVHHGGSTFEEDLIHLVNDEATNISIRCAIIRGYGLKGNSAYIPLLQKLTLEKQPEEVHNETVLALAMLGDHHALQELLQLCMQKQFAERHQRQLALRCLALHSDVAELLPLLEGTTLSLEWRIYLVRQLRKRDEKTVILPLLELLHRRVIIREVRAVIADVIGMLADDEATVHQLVDLLPGSDIANQIHQALWSVCRRAGVTVIASGPGNTQLRVEKRRH
ncbi:NACHT domain-containing protein [Ktedonobacter racemifer]|uniref:Putative signal transduction protein with Nacht domain n=1 Tax=Ktedonobacter racemifer DSM 44963 TaxID=485913 RepID=D6TGT5_KTERA|nr:HEAT repeat domain-containing protein [Ktedonobacter racemifer]EFH88864.1 putative signal transduction protein with Nacht domain [Ktedonobacter racemifer DSM 44963]